MRRGHSAALAHVRGNESLNSQTRSEGDSNSSPPQEPRAANVPNLHEYAVRATGRTADGTCFDLSSLHERYSHHLEVGWDSRLESPARKGGIPEYNALRDRHCTYTRSKAFRASPYARLAQRVKQLGGGAAGAGVLAGAGLADRSVLREFLEEANRQKELQAKGGWGSQKAHPLSAPPPVLPPVSIYSRSGDVGGLVRSALGVSSTTPLRGPSGPQAGPLLEMQVFKCIIVRQALLSKARKLARRLRRNPTDVAALRGSKTARRTRYRALHDHDQRTGAQRKRRLDTPSELVEEGLAALLDRLRVCTGPLYFFHAALSTLRPSQLYVFCCVSPFLSHLSFAVVRVCVCVPPQWRRAKRLLDGERAFVCRRCLGHLCKGALQPPKARNGLMLVINRHLCGTGAITCCK